MPTIGSAVLAGRHFERPPQDAKTGLLVSLDLRLFLLDGHGSAADSFNPGAFTARHENVPRSLFTTRVAKASPSTSSAMTSNGRPVSGVAGTPTSKSGA